MSLFIPSEEIVPSSSSSMTKTPEQIAQEEKDKAEVLAQQEAAMKMAERKAKAKPEASPLSQIDIGSFGRKIIGFLTRNFFNMKNVALAIAFMINLLLLFYKASAIESENGDDSEEDDSPEDDVPDGGDDGGDDDDEDGGGARDKSKKQESAADRVMGDVESSDEEEVGDGEGTDMTRRVERQGDREYEEMEDEEIDMNKEIDKDLGDEYMEDEEDTKQGVVAQAEDDEGLGDEYMEDDHESAAPTQLSQEDAMASGEPARRRADVLRLLDGRGGVASIVDYGYDTEKQNWATLTLSFDIARKRVDMSQVLRVAAGKAVVYEVKDIKRSFVLEDKGKMILKTEGINIDAMFHYDHILDIKSMGCNNIHDMAKYYGIEAANQTIVNEITGVFNVYGIEVDKRHLSLIADFMTFDGNYKPFNRVGIENNASPLQQMTFETAMGFLRQATLGGKTDNLTSPSACVVLGKPTRGGTGSFSLMQRLS
eukprot:TRINITY_DN24413_c0_g1_i1.p1 TRINITY_DN24413_c0_g1~~TRINITY_DN24413_c0_g1_i1.p1  ORF type:complete len:562 (+),score=235.92 TRINITY_DN24413_c0_g1_i1:241-1686(+)